MILMINGAFGVGKTSLAERLVNEIPNSMLFDPENVGFFLREILPDDVKQREADSGDFQDFKLWKELTVQVAEHLVSTYQMLLIVPMTIRNKNYLDYIRSGFEKVDEDTHHFCLLAKKETIFERLRERGEEEGNWCFQQADSCLKAFEEEDFHTYIETDHKPLSQVVEEIKETIEKPPSL
ncbi:AAA family ATPase [Halobacillus sp. BBL2006]|uniref:AAA family ATPase n=1 Tax=Halobacillus sp. BBL2006 TaxID=1543706 RepID=UPI0005443B71|nr:AAA family ATPase [Halobacillus sp. BBL2006]KHE67694.1 Tunicamycin resistance protein [Halobacillus sp. BBL2006]